MGRFHFVDLEQKQLDHTTGLATLFNVNLHVYTLYNVVQHTFDGTP